MMCVHACLLQLSDLRLRKPFKCAIVLRIAGDKSRSKVSWLGVLVEGVTFIYLLLASLLECFAWKLHLH